MKHFFALISLFCITTHAQAADPGVHLFLLSGQSNMARLDPKRVFTPGVEKQFGAENVVVVKNAQGGQPIRRWDKGWVTVEGQKSQKIGDLYDALMSDVTSAMKGKTIKSVTFIWMQGERDARGGFSQHYADSFTRVMDQLRSDLEWPDINFIIRRLSDFGIQNKEWNKMRSIQEGLADASPRGAWVNTDDLNDGVKVKGEIVDNDIHYSKKGYDILAERYIEKAIQLIKENS